MSSKRKMGDGSFVKPPPRRRYDVSTPQKDTFVIAFDAHEREKKKSRRSSHRKSKDKKKDKSQDNNNKKYDGELGVSLDKQRDSESSAVKSSVIELPTLSSLSNVSHIERNRHADDPIMLNNPTSKVATRSSPETEIDLSRFSVPSDPISSQDDYKYIGNNIELKEEIDSDEEDSENETNVRKFRKSASPYKSPPQAIGQQGTSISSRRNLGKEYSFEDSIILNMFFKQVNKIDKLSEYFPRSGDPVLESISEILFKPYPRPLQLFGALIWLAQFLTLLCLLYSLLPCPDEKPSWLVFVGVPLACAYAGIEAIHHVLRYVHLGHGYRLLKFLMIANSLLQLLCVGVVMGKSINLLTLISNFVGVAVVLQIDEFLASYIRIKDIDPELLGEKSWRTKMRLKSKIFLVIIAAFIVYVVTAVIWRVDSMYCDSYKFDDHS